MLFMRIDLHVHTKYSYDSSSSLDEIKHYMLVNRIDMIAITDHESIRAWKYARDKHISFIPGEEIKTDKGDVIGLFLTEEIKSRSFFDVIDEIKSQGGIVYIPHPFDIFRHGVGRLYTYGDVVEVINGKSLFLFDMIIQFLSKSKLKGAGSDAHYPEDVGTVYVEIANFDSSSSFLKNLEFGKLKIKRRTLPTSIKKLIRSIK